MADVSARANFKQSCSWVDESLFAACDLDRVGARIERSHLVDPFHWWQIKLVAETEIQRQPGTDLPIVLEVEVGAESHRIVKRLAQVAVALEGQAQQHIGRRITRVSPVEAEGASPKRSEERVEEKAANISAPLHRVRAVGEGHVFNIMIGVVVAALGEIGWPADGGESGYLQLRRAVIERRAACIGQPFDTQPIDHVYVAILLKAEKAKAGIPDAHFVDQARAEKVRPGKRHMLGTLQLVAAPAGYVTRRAKGVGDRKELGGVSELIDAEEIGFVVYLVVNPAGERVDAEAARPGGDEIIGARTVRIRKECKQSRALRVPELLRNLIAGEGLIVIRRIAELRADRTEVAAFESRWRYVC